MTPTRPRILITKPALGEEEAAAAREVILSGWVAQGAQVAAFEEEFAAYVDASEACAVSSCTTALHLALIAVGVRPGDEVITVSHTFIATANAICHCGARPVFVDIDPGTYNMDPRQLEAAISRNTRAILPVHQMGLPCDMAAIGMIAQRHGLPVVEDAACALGSQIRAGGTWERIGRPHGTVACFSFHPRKVITTGEGGMIATRDVALARKCRLLRQQGANVSADVRHAAKTIVFENYPLVGFNYRMTDLQAAIGRVQLRRFADLLSKRSDLAASYTRALGGISGLCTLQIPEYARTNFQSFPVRVTPEYPLGRDQLMQALLDQGISTRRGIMNIHQEAAYADHSIQRLPCSEDARDSVILLPLHPGLTADEMARVVSQLRDLGKKPERANDRN